MAVAAWQWMTPCPPIPCVVPCHILTATSTPRRPRYFPEPDLPPLTITAEEIKAVQASMGELPDAQRERYVAMGECRTARGGAARHAVGAQRRQQCAPLVLSPLALRAIWTPGLAPGDVAFLVDDMDAAAYLDASVAAGAAPKAAANWVMGDLAAHCKASKVAFADLALTPPQLAELVTLIEQDVISGKIAKQVGAEGGQVPRDDARWVPRTSLLAYPQILPSLLTGAAGSAGGVRKLVEASGLVQQSDPEAIRALVRKVLLDSPKEVEQYRGGKTKLMVSQCRAQHAACCSRTRHVRACGSPVAGLLPRPVHEGVGRQGEPEDARRDPQAHAGWNGGVEELACTSCGTPCLLVPGAPRRPSFAL